MAIDALLIGGLDGRLVAAAGGWPVGQWVGGTFSVSRLSGVGTNHAPGKGILRNAEN